MPPRVLLTGIPSHYTRLIQGADGCGVFYSERPPLPEDEDGFLRELKNISNTGNYLIGEGALQALGAPVTHIPFWHLHNYCASGRGLEIINAKFDFCVFTCANLLRKGLSADAEAEVISQLRMPIVMMGIGIQRCSDLLSELPAGTRALLDVLKKREHYFLTRGDETAAFLRDAGFSYVKPVGCPSTYHYADNIRKALGRLPEIRIGEAKTVFSGYLGTTTDTVNDINDLGGTNGASFYVLQDEPLHFDMHIERNGDDRVYDAASGQLIGRIRFKRSEELRRPVKLYAFFDTNQWRAWTSTMDFSFGRRFHGSIIALQAGVPSLMVAVDDRMREMLAFVGLPYLEAEELERAENRAELVGDRLAALNTAHVIEKYSNRESAFRSIIREIGLA